MSDRATPEPVNPPAALLTPGGIALALMGWLDLAVSVALFVIGVPVVAAFFALMSVFFGGVAGQIRHSRERERLRRGGAPVQHPPFFSRANTLMFAALLAATALIIPALLYTVGGSYTRAGVFALWSLALVLLAGRVRR